MLLSDLLARSARAHPDRDALVFPHDRIRYGALDRQANQVANRLCERGLGPGSRVGVFDGNHLSAAVLFWGALSSGASTVDIPLQADDGALARILAESPLDALISSEAGWARLRAGGHTLPPLLLDGSAAESDDLPATAERLERIVLEEPHTPPAGGAGNPDDVALTVYTSGTTGRPKGVMLSHENLISNLRAAEQRMPLHPDDSILVVVPLHFIHGRMQLLAHTRVGGTLVFSGGFQLPQAVVAELARHGVSGFSGVPYHYTALLERSALARTELPALRYVLITGGSLAPATMDRLAAALPGVEIHLAYGQTEAAPRITHLGPDERSARPGSCGRPLPGVTVELLDSDGVEVPRGEIGEVVASGPNIMLDYAGGDALACGALDGQHRLHTGDLGRFDADGYLYLQGRRSEMIKQAGERIFPREIEEVIDAHPGVSESAVLGLPDDLYGEAVTALVVPADPALTPGAIRAHCLGVFSYVRAPRRIHLVAALPKTTSGKIDRSALAALVPDPSTGPRAGKP